MSAPPSLPLHSLRAAADSAQLAIHGVARQHAVGEVGRVIVPACLHIHLIVVAGPSMRAFKGYSHDFDIR